MSGRKKHHPMKDDKSPLSPPKKIRRDPVVNADDDSQNIAPTTTPNQDPKAQKEEKKEIETGKKAVGDDDQDRSIVKTGEILNETYEVVKLLGRGRCSEVFEVKSLAEGTLYAMKIIRLDPLSRATAKAELKAFKMIAEKDPKDEHHLLHAKQVFNVHNHHAFLLDLCGPNLFGFMTINRFRPFPLDQIRLMAFQLCTAVAFLHSNELVHTDLKLDNVVLVCGEYSRQKDGSLLLKRADVKLLDFGMTHLAKTSDKPKYIVACRNNRAPEIVLKLGWSTPCDVWAVACILFFIRFGKPPFRVKNGDDKRHLSLMAAVLGELPLAMREKTELEMFNNANRTFEPAKDDLDYVKNNGKPLEDFVRSEEDRVFVALLREMLTYDPDQRPTLEVVLSGPYFRKENEVVSKESH